ncbi:MAG: hypothetical protein NTY07_05660 [Bacteroidia bacterium]|nr:hypothetical protein [Bacteroidia bacterium]
MTREENQIARVVFQNRILRCSGQAFEDLFIRVMQAYDHGFQPVKPHGREGDRKCDGFNKSTGQYYQVYAPEDLSGKERFTQEKLEETIGGIFSYWQSISPIQEFYFAINDKYAGVWPSIHLQLSQIGQKYQVKTDTFLCKDLENIFLELPDNEITDIVGPLPSAANITNIDISVLGEVIDFLMNFGLKPLEEGFPEDPNFDKKIKFNNLSDGFAMMLKVAYRQTYLIDDFFMYQGSFPKQDLKLVFNDIYLIAQELVPLSMENRSDVIFQSIWDKASPRNTMSIKNAVLVLMAHYFESCDIFKEPIEPRQQNLFE